MSRVFEAISPNTERRATSLFSLAVAIGAVALAVHEKRRSNDYKEQIKMLEIDELTGLYRREVWFSKSVDMIVDNPNSVFGVIIVDINNLKTVNDVYGHDKGDDCLILGAEALRSSIRQDGITGRQDDIAGRFGGDEFAMLMNFQKNGGEEDLNNAVNRLKHVFDKSLIREYEDSASNTALSLASLGVGIAVGGTLLSLPAGASRMYAENLLNKAVIESDGAMYDDKARSKV